MGITMKHGYIIASATLAISFIFDRMVLDFFSLIKNPILDAFFGAVEILRPALLAFAVLIIVSEALFLIKNKKLSLKLMISLVAVGGITYLLKIITGRTRPTGLENSFPSAHTSLTFTPTVFLKRFKSIWIVLACYVALSRLYLNHHYLSDVIAGAILGYGVGDLINRFKR